LPKTLVSMVSPDPALFYTLIPSPLGPIGIVATPRGLCRVSFRVRDASAFRKDLQKEYDCSPVRRDRRFHKIANRLQAYFEGKPVRFNAALDLRAGGGRAAARGTVSGRGMWEQLVSAIAQ